MNNLNSLLEDINRANLRQHQQHFAFAELTSPEVMKALIESGASLFKIRSDKVLFGYSQPVAGIGFTPVSREQAINWFDALEEEDVQPNPPEGGSCEIVEISPEQWQILKEISKNERPSVSSEDIEWLAAAGLITLTSGNTPMLTQTARSWVGMER